MVSRNDKDGGSPFGDLQERFECLCDMNRGNSAPVEKITSMDHQIDLALERRSQSAIEVLEEVNPPPPPADSWM